MRRRELISTVPVNPAYGADVKFLVNRFAVCRLDRRLRHPVNALGAQWYKVLPFALRSGGLQFRLDRLDKVGPPQYGTQIVLEPSAELYVSI